MPGRFRFTQADVRGEGEVPAAGRTMPPEVVQFEPKVERVVREYEPKRIIKPGTGDYQFTRQNFGPMAASDEPRVIKARKDSRFVVSNLSREPLAIDAEERRAFEERVRQEVGALAQETFNTAKAEGYKAGLQAGEEKAYAETRASSLEMLDNLASLSESVESHRKRLLDQQERFLMELVFKIAKKVCLKELSGDTNYVTRMLHAMIEQAGTRENLRVRISLQDLEVLSSLRQELVTRWGELKNLSIEPSAQVPSGACELETDLASYSASLDSQLESIHGALFEGQVRESS